MPRPVAPREIVLRSADGRDLLRLGAIGSDSGYPSVEVRVDAKARGFSGGGEAWIDGFELKRFATDLRALEKSREGRVELRSMNPEELRLVIRSVDHAGHLRVEFTISRKAPAGDQPELVALRVSGALELDAGTLPEVVEGFTRLAAALAA